MAGRRLGITKCIIKTQMKSIRDMDKCKYIAVKVNLTTHLPTRQINDICSKHELFLNLIIDFWI